MATTYVVMLDADDDDPNTLTVLGTAEGDTPREAVKAYSEPEGEPPVDGRFVAVPIRNWSEETAAAEVRVSYKSSGYQDNGTATADPQPEEEDEAEQLAAAIEDES